MIRLILFLYRWFMSWPQSLRYLCVGGGNTLVGIALFAAFYAIFKDFFPAALILIVSSFFSITFSFFTLKYFVFCAKGAFRRHYPRTMVVQFSALALNAVVLDFAVATFPDFHAVILQSVITFAIAILTYFAHRFFSFG